MRLGEYLVAEKKITQAELDEALESQVIHGGRLGTNLLELGLVTEQDLGTALGKLLNVPHAAGEMAPDPKALELVDADFADDKDLVPMRVDATRLSVAALNPHDFQAFDALAFKTGKRVMPVVVCEFRMHRLLRKHCKAFRPLRAIDIEGPKVRPKPGEAVPGAPAKPLDLMAEEEFQQLYAQALAEGDGAVVASAEIARAMTPSHGIPAVVPKTAPMPKGPPVAQQPNAVAPPVAAPQPKAAPQRPPEPPLSFAEAQAALAKSSNREDIAHTILRFASGKWKRSLLLSVQGDLVTGWHGMGALREQAVKRIGISLRTPNTFRLVRDLRSHYVGPVKHDAHTMVFYKLLGGGFPQTAVLLPLLVRGKVVHILYVDNGPDQLTPPDVGELLILSQSVGRSYEAMMQRRKRA